MNKKAKIISLFAFLTVLMCGSASAQKYPSNLIDKTVAVVGGEMISLSEIESELQMLKAQGDERQTRCSVLEGILQTKLFLMQARVDSLTVNQEMVNAELTSRMDNVRTYLGSDDAVEKYFGKSIYRLRQDWRRQMEEAQLTQREQQEIASAIPSMTPYDVRHYLDTVSRDNLPVIPIKYRYSQICLYPDRDSAALACRQKLLEIRERIINGEKFSTLARLYSEDPGSSRKGGELGMASKSVFWPSFSDAAMSLKPGKISQVVETPDGFHIIEVIERKGDMFNARHILLQPKYTNLDRDKAFVRLDSLRNAILEGSISFEIAAGSYSEDPATRTNGGQVADPATGSVYFEIDKLKPQDYHALESLKEGEISRPVSSLDNEGREGKTVYKILRLDKIVPAHTASFEHDYSELLQNVEYARKLQAIDEFVDNKIKETHIVIDPIFKDCTFSRKGWEEKFKQ